MAGDVKRGDIRLYRFPAPDKERPVLVLTRDSALRFLTYGTVAPTFPTFFSCAAIAYIALRSPERKMEDEPMSMEEGMTQWQ